MISVVIPTLDEADQIEAALASAGAPGAPSLEAIVVDGGSRDRTCALAAAAGARVLRSEPGRARQLDLGARQSRGEVILFLHADTRLPEAWDAHVRSALEDPQTVGGAFRFRFDRSRGDLTPTLRWVEWGARLRVALFGLPYGDQALFIRRRVLEAIGGVPQVPIMEDLDLVRAMKRAGNLARLRADATTSARRHRGQGPLRLSARHAFLALGWGLGIDRASLAAWSRR